MLNMKNVLLTYARYFFIPVWLNMKSNICSKNGFAVQKIRNKFHAVKYTVKLTVLAIYRNGFVRGDIQQNRAYKSKQKIKAAAYD